VRVYNAEEHIGETLEGILSQTRPADEVIVVDDGSTDDTPSELERFRGDVRVVRQPNGGYADAFNRCFHEASGDYVANCDADDIWEPTKLERQVDALTTRPEIDIAFGDARFFGLKEGPYAAHSTPPGVQDKRAFARQLYRADPICASSTVIRRQLFHRVGPFRATAAPCEDYDYWLRAAASGAVFFFDPAVLLRYRAHAQQVSHNLLRMHRREYLVHKWFGDLVEKSGLARKVQARDLSNIARVLVDEGRPAEARTTFVSSLRHRPTLRVLAWVAVLSTPDRLRAPLADGLVSVKRGLISAASR
jgi:glycosyltransferase involved in cell wall biosynthesis